MLALSVSLVAWTSPLLTPVSRQQRADKCAAVAIWDTNSFWRMEQELESTKPVQRQSFNFGRINDEVSLKRRFKKLAVEIHPDRNPDENTERFAQLSTEYSARLSELQEQQHIARLDATWQIWGGATALASAVSAASVVVPTACVLGFATHRHINTLNEENSSAEKVVRKAEEAADAAAAQLELAKVKAWSWVKELDRAEAAAARAENDETDARLRLARAVRANRYVPDELLLQSVSAHHEMASARAAKKRATAAAARRRATVLDLQRSVVGYDCTLRAAEATVAACTTALEEARAEKATWADSVQAWKAKEDKANQVLTSVGQALAAVGLVATGLTHEVLGSVFGTGKAMSAKA